MFIKDTILVLGHRNPDMDAIASAVGYAWILNTAISEKYVAGRLGELNAQTQFALDHFKVDSPTLVPDVYPRLGDIAVRQEAMNGTTTIQDACKYFATHERPIPLVNEDGKPAGMITAASLFHRLSNAILYPFALAEQLNQSAFGAVESEALIFNSEQRLTEVRGRVLTTNQDDFLVIDGDGKYLGVVRRREWLEPPNQLLILVDHNEVGQSVPGIEEAEVIEILDHHRLDTITTLNPITMQIAPIGSTSTLVYERAQSRDMVLPPGIAGLLLCGILSDTLVFQSPTTTMRDQRAAEALAKMANLSDDVKTFGGTLLAAGAGLRTRSADDIINTDLKFYNVGTSEIGLAQVEITNFAELEQRADDLYEGMKQLTSQKGLALAVLMVTNVVSGDSRLIITGDSHMVAALPFTRLDGFMFDAPGMVSRKKQLAPMVLATLSKVG
jgi:manganese-dependent inorganic pyrophosphatase